MNGFVEQTQTPLVIFVRDLLFSSKVVATARAEGIAFKAVRDVSKLLDTPGGLLVVDLNAAEALEAAMAWKARFGGRVIGFVAHVETDRIGAARGAGMDQVLSNGAFTAQLPAIVRSALPA